MPDSVMLFLTVWAALAQTLFIVIYATRPWWRAFVGRALFTKSLALALLLDLAVARHYFDDPWLDLLFDVLFAGVVAGITFQLAALVHEVRHHRRAA